MNIRRRLYHVVSPNFLEYGGFALTVKLFMDNLEKAAFNLTRPANSLLYSILL